MGLSARFMNSSRRSYYQQGVRRKDVVCRQSEPAIYHCYWNYFRIYIPKAAVQIKPPQVPLHEGAEKLIWGYPDPDSGSLVQGSDVGAARLNEIGGFIAVEPGSIATVPVDYQLPWKMVLSTGQGIFEYRLLIQKQAGMDTDRVSVRVEPPPGTEIVHTSPEVSRRSGRSVIFDFPLDSNKEVVVVFKA